jgi:hypothetical protein
MPFPPNWPAYIPKDKLAALGKGKNQEIDEKGHAHEDA